MVRTAIEAEPYSIGRASIGSGYSWQNWNRSGMSQP
jgi:hypothetical protein